jgi:signal transduction histidine kinase
MKQSEIPQPDADQPMSMEGPRLELDELLAQLVDRAQDVMGAQSRLRGLLRANRMIVGDLALPVVLRRIVEAACELVHARYGALGVIAPGGGLEQFIHVGMDPETVARIGHLPEGKGLLGALIDDPRPIRLQDMAADPRSVGFPPDHPPMDSFLGVPIRVRDEVYGNLYLTGHDQSEVSAEDEELVLSLAASAGVAIENARLFDEARKRQEWLQASTEITRQLLSNEGEEPLRVIARRLQQIADADAVNVVLPTPEGGRLMVEVATGAGADQLTGLSYPIENTVSQLVLDNGRAVLIGDISLEQQHSVHLSEFVPIGPLMVLPLVGTQRVRGALVVGRLHGRPRFTAGDLEMATTFANHAAVAVELADARADQERVALLEDRDRIARDLHDHVIQRLFGAGLTVQSIASGLGDESFAHRLGRVVTDIDETIRQIRTSIFQLRGPLGPATGAVRARLLAVAAEIAPSLQFAPRLTFSGPVDSVVPEAVADELVAVLREALSNVARHASAKSVAVNLDANSHAFNAEVSLAITDDGVGMGDTERRSGLANLRERAECHGGSFTIRSPLGDPDSSGTEAGAQLGAPGGTRLLWTIPLN